MFSITKAIKVVTTRRWSFPSVGESERRCLQVGLARKYNVSVTFNVSDLTPFDNFTDLRTNPFQEGEDDVSTSSTTPNADPEVLPQGPITRSRARQFREVLNATCLKFIHSLYDDYALESRCFNVLHADM